MILRRGVDRLTYRSPGRASLLRYIRLDQASLAHIGEEPEPELRAHAILPPASLLSVRVHRRKQYPRPCTFMNTDHPRGESSGSPLVAVSPYRYAAISGRGIDRVTVGLANRDRISSKHPGQAQKRVEPGQRQKLERQLSAAQVLGGKVDLTRRGGVEGLVAARRSGMPGWL
jgi:hypothetical protein